MIPDNLVTQIGNIVSETATEVLEQLQKVDNNIKQLGFLYGSAEEIREALKEKDESPNGKYLKYPLIAMITPFDEEPGTLGGYHSKVYPKIAIINQTSKDYKSPERYEENINKILLPIYNAFIQCLLDSGYYPVYTERDLKLKCIIRDDIGDTGFVMLDGATYDYVDAIELPGMELVRDYQYNN